MILLGWVNVTRVLTRNSKEIKIIFIQEYLKICVKVIKNRKSETVKCP
jgi:hypothetical protein